MTTDLERLSYEKKAERAVQQEEEKASGGSYQCL